MKLPKILLLGAEELSIVLNCCNYHSGRIFEKDQGANYGRQGIITDINTV